MTKALALWLVLMSPAWAAAQSESFVVRMGRDTIAIETFVLNAQRLEGELSGPALPNRMRYQVELSNGLPGRMKVEMMAANSDTAAMRAELTFVGDSVLVQSSSAGAAQPAQRLGTTRNAVPFINLAFSFVELATTQARRVTGDSTLVHYFIVTNGGTLPSKLKWITADSAVMSLGGVELRLQLDARGRILHATVPSQNVTVERVAGTLQRGAEARPDYSAPVGASYSAQDVIIKTAAGHTLAGTLTLPKARRGKIPAVVTISGSGPQDRDESLIILRGYRPFRELADMLAARGVAVLRYDDRGYGASTGVYATATSADFASDTRAVLAYLRTRPEIDADKLFLLGHSEGGLIAPLVAAEESRLRGIVLLAGPAYTGRKILEYQTRHGADLQTEKTAAERDSLYAAGMRGLDSAAVLQPWMRFFRDHDPVPVLRKVRVPVLVVQGETDRQVTAEQAGIIARELRAAGNSNVAVHVLPGVNHLFLSDPVGNATGYATLPTRTVVPQLLQIVGDWIVNHSK
ncbi:MAG TPA: alpha/beta fold hydrolase [Longimicrobiales bacterium]|nr:alpha/beta fold hydrolase [Longimicrobiales bacterium]